LLLWRNRVWLLLLLLLPLLPLLWGKRVSLLLLWGKHIWLLPLLKCRVLLIVFAFYLCSLLKYKRYAKRKYMSPTGTNRTNKETSDKGLTNTKGTCKVSKFKKKSKGDS
jgi:membrane protein implicated in regulation of membrane protease activity